MSAQARSLACFRASHWEGKRSAWNEARSDQQRLPGGVEMTRVA